MIIVDPDSPVNQRTVGVLKWLAEHSSDWTGFDRDLIRKMQDSELAAVDILVDAGLVKAKIIIPLHYPGIRDPERKVFHVCGEWRKSLNHELSNVWKDGFRLTPAIPKWPGDLVAIRITAEGEDAARHDRMRIFSLALGEKKPGQIAECVEGTLLLNAPDGEPTTTGKTAKRKTIPKNEAEVLVRDWLSNNAVGADPASIKRDDIVKATGVSAGNVSNTAAWKAFDAERKALSKPTERTVPLTDAMIVSIPASDNDEELADLIRQQKADHAEQERRHNRRHDGN